MCAHLCSTSASLRSAGFPCPKRGMQIASRVVPTNTAQLVHPARRRHLCAGRFRVRALYERQSTDDLLGELRRRRRRADDQGEEPNPTTSTPSTSAKVYLVGCGPGSADLLTLRAVNLMRRADVVLYDRLVSEETLSYCSSDAVLVYVGKQESLHSRSQEEINELIGIFASELDESSTVVRLKGGDPFIFGRGGEEAQYLRSLGIDVGVVPGMTSACAIGAELGIPLTHRTLATSVRFLTGHARENGQSDIDEAMATAFDTKTTLVIYMGLRTLDQTVETLLSGGLPRNTPAAAVEKGCSPEQRAVYSTLENLYEAVQDAQPKLASPTLIIIGEVVSLAPGYAGNSSPKKRECSSSFNFL
jgi:uroporphyrin-III C-methyltransferase